MCQSHARYIQRILCSLFPIGTILSAESRYSLREILDGTFRHASYLGLFCVYHHLSNLRKCSDIKAIIFPTLLRREESVKQTALRMWMQKTLSEIYKQTAPLLTIIATTNRLLRWMSLFPSNGDLFLWMVIPSSTALLITWHYGGAWVA